MWNDLQQVAGDPVKAHRAAAHSEWVIMTEVPAVIERHARIARILGVDLQDLERRFMGQARAAFAAATVETEGVAPAVAQRAA